MKKQKTLFAWLYRPIRIKLLRPAQTARSLFLHIPSIRLLRGNKALSLLNKMPALVLTKKRIRVKGNIRIRDLNAIEAMDISAILHRQREFLSEIMNEELKRLRQELKQASPQNPKPASDVHNN